jgi:hypothetical protein
MKKILILSLLFIIVKGLYSQTEFDKYKWNTLPATGNADTIKGVKGTVIALERRITEIYLNKENIFEEISVYHKKLKLESHEAIDNYNKIYIPVSNVLEIISIKARFFSPSGKITELPQSSIRLLENLENKGDFKTFAIEGAETGGQLEYYYILRKKFNPYGTIYFQDDVPRAGAEVIIAYPSKLEFIVKSYNGFPRFVLTEGENGTNYLKAAIGYIPAIEKELYSNYRANLMRYEFTLAYNRYISSLRVYSWATACKTLYASTFLLERNEQSAIGSLIKKMKIPEGTIEARIRHIENWVKSEISIAEEGDLSEQLTEVIRSKQTSKYGIIRLMVALFDAVDIDFELLVTGDNEDQPFDPDFNGFNFLKNQLLYFPAINNYLVPDDPDYRLGLIPGNYQGSFALYTRPVAYDEKLKSLSYDIRQIPVENPLINTDSIVQEVWIDTDHNLLKARSHRVFCGMNAATFQSFWHLVDNDRKDEIVQSVFNMGKQNTEIDSYTVRNDAPENIGVNPLVWDLEITANSLVETAGSDILVKIGETIGTQSELYQANTRKLPVDVGILRNYYRKIQFKIPPGYKVTNASDLNMDVRMMNNDEISCIFNSIVESTDGLLTITVIEYYNEPHYPVERYEDFRKVINAAADFNKKTLLLSKI